MKYKQPPAEAGDPRGEGKIRCEICHLPVRDHRIGPCPFWDKGSDPNGMGDRGRRTR